MSAALSGQMGAVNVLLDQGADPNLRDNRGNSALRCAIENCHIAVVNQLCQRGADPSRADGRGVTDAAYAAHAGVPLPRRVGGV